MVLRRGLSKTCQVTSVGRKHANRLTQHDGLSISETAEASISKEAHVGAMRYLWWPEGA